MNILGKILVFLNLLFALLVGGFLVIDFATRTNWKTAYEDLKREMEVSKANTGALIPTTQNLNKKLAALEQQLKDAQDDLRQQKEDSDKKIAAYKKQVDLSEEIKLPEYVNSEKFLAELNRFKIENKTLHKLAEDRADAMFDLEKEKDKYYKDMQQALNERDIAISRMQNLQDRLKELTLWKAQNQVTKANPQGTAVLSGKKSNPPSFYVKGLVEKVDAEQKDLVLISLGKDQGIDVGHTLYAYRNRPNAKYLGEIRIMEVTARKAVGRLLPSYQNSYTTLKAGDQVASSILPY